MRNKPYINNNMFAFIRLEMYKNNISISDVSKKLDIDEMYLLNFFNRHNKTKKNEILLSVLGYLGIDEKIVFKRNLAFEKMRNDFFNSIFYCLKEREDIYKKIISISNQFEYSPYKVDILIIKYVYCVAVSENYAQIDSYKKCFDEILSSLSLYYKKIYYVFSLYYFNNTSQYSNINKLFNYIEKIPCYDIHLDGRVNYLGLSIFRRLGMISKAKRCYLVAQELFNRVKNYSMLENLNIKYSGLLRMTGEIQAALHNDLKLLEDYTIKKHRLRNIEILYNNIAWTYSLLYDYRKAIIYYQKALETLNDNDVYFNMAYCCFKVGEKALAMNYLQLGKKAPNCGEYIYLLLDWLEQMIKDIYSNKSFQMLQNILLKYENDLEEVDKNTIQIEIINYYYYNGMYEEAINALQPLMGKQLISPSELIFAKNNDKIDQDTLSFDDIDDVWNDEKINDDDWEELDDSFSSFAFN